MSTLITIFSDASYKDEHSGYGYWFKSKYTSGTGTGRERANSIDHAELLGICRAINKAWLRHKKIIPQNEIRFVIQCDNISALGMLLTHGAAKVVKDSKPIELRKKWSPEELQLVEEIRQHLPDSTLYLKHIKAHTKNKDARSRVNQLTDRLSKEASGSNGGRGTKGEKPRKSTLRNGKTLYGKITGPRGTGL
jgi:RNase H